MAINNIVDESFIINQKKLKQFGDRCSNVKIGIMGGTFDPIHYAHLATAEFIRDNYKLDKILFIPSGNPPHKKGNITDKYDRYNMVLLSTVNNDDFIVSDIEMPLMDGHRLTKLIKTDDELKHIPVILFSSLISDELRIKGQEVGADEQITKPEIVELVNIIDRLIK